MERTDINTVLKELNEKLAESKAKDLPFAEKLVAFNNLYDELTIVRNSLTNSQLHDPVIRTNINELFMEIYMARYDLTQNSKQKDA